MREMSIDLCPANAQRQTLILLIERRARNKQGIGLASLSSRTTRP